MTSTGAQAAFSVLAFLAESSVRVLALALVAGLAIAALRRRRAAAHLWIWTIILYAAMAMPVAMRLVPSVGVPVPDLAVPGLGGQAVASQVVFTGSTTANQSGVSGVPPAPATSAVDPIQIMCAIYLIGVVVLLLRAGVGWMMTRRLERAAEAIDDEHMLARLARHSSAAGLRRAPLLTQSSRLHVPVTTSVRRPMLLLPATWREWSGAKADAVLVHELAHVARRDTLTQRLSLIYRAAFWPNPFSWWLHRHIAALAEQASDDAALDAGIDRTTYAETLVGFLAAGGRESGWRAVWHVAMAREAGSSAEKRVERVLAWNRNHSGVLSKAMAVGILLGVAVIMAMVAVVRFEQVTLLAVPARTPIIVTAEPLPPELRQYTDRTDPQQLPVPQAPAPQQKSPAVIPGALPHHRTPIYFYDFGRPLTPQTSPAIPAGVYTGHNGKEFYFFNDVPVQPRPVPTAIDVTLARRSKPLSFVSQTSVPPKPITRVDPKYTSDAMRAKLEGTVELQVTILKDGTVSDIKVTKSLDPGLDQQAIAAAKLWTFQPATKDGQPVEYVATLLMEFRIHPKPAWADAYAPDTPGLVAPKVTKWADPKYTSDALRAKLQGDVEVEVLVLSDGTVGDARVTQSLDKVYGLDDCALAAAKQFTFTPGSLNGQQVAVAVKVNILFRIH